MTVNFENSETIPIALIFITLLFLILFILFIINYLAQRGIRASKTKDAAKALLKDIREARHQLGHYNLLIEQLDQAYANNSDTIPLKPVPALQIQVDKIKLSPDFTSNCNEINNNFRPVFYWRNHVMKYSEAYVSGLMFSGYINLFKRSKEGGFLRKSKLLEEYITDKYRSSTKKHLSDTVSEDYFDENAYVSLRSLKSEIDVFKSSKDILDNLEDCLRFIINHPI